MVLPSVTWLKVRANLGSGTDLTRLSLVFPNVVDLALLYCRSPIILPAFHVLLILDLTGCSLQDAALDQLVLLTSLQHLSLAHNQELTDAKLALALEALPQLLSLDLRHCDVGAATMHTLGKLAVGYPLQDESLESMAVVTSYIREAVAFREFAVKLAKRVSEKTVGQMKGLQALWLCVERLPDRTWDDDVSLFAPLTPASSLVYLHLDKMNVISQKDLLALAAFLSLKILVLTSCNLNFARTLEPLGRLSETLRILDLRGNATLRPSQVYDTLSPLFSERTIITPPVQNMRLLDPKNMVFKGLDGRSAGARDRNVRRALQHTENLLGGLKALAPVVEEAE